MFETFVGILIVGGALGAFLAYQRSRVVQQPANLIAADDPEMAAARASAQSSLAEFKKLYAQYPGASLAKLPTTSSAGMLEWMVGDVVELTDTYVKVEFRGKPVTHRGPFQQVQTFPLREIADWHVATPDGRYRGGFTDRVRFNRMRVAGALSGSEAEEAEKYD